MSFEWVMRILVENWPMFLRGAGITLLIALVGTIFGAIIGLLIGVVRTIPLPERGIKRALLKIVNGILAVYIEIFRGTPMIVQAMVIFYGTALAFGLDMDRIFAAIIIVSINTGAYMAEFVRGGIVSIEKGQYEAAQAIGMNHFQTMTNVILPQVIRNIIPATGNQFIINIKETSLANSISCVTISIVKPDCARSFITFNTSPTISGSRAEVGSSNSMTSGSIDNARAIATRCFCPPESCLGFAFTYCSIPTTFKYFSAFCSASSLERLNTLTCPTTQFWSTL